MFSVLNSREVSRDCKETRATVSLLWAPIFAILALLGRRLELTKAGLRVKETKGRNIRTIPVPDDGDETLKRIQTAKDDKRKMYGTDYRTDLDQPENPGEHERDSGMIPNSVPG